MKYAFPAVLSLATLGWIAAPAFADEPLPRNPGTTLRTGSGGDLKGTTRSGTTLRTGSGGDLKGTTLRGTTLSGTTTRAGTGAAKGTTVGTSERGSADAAHPGFAAKASGHGSSPYWNTQYHGAPALARRGVVAAPAAVVATVEPAPARATASGTVVVDRGVAPPPTVFATPARYVESPTARPAPVPVATRIAQGVRAPAFRGARLGDGSFGGIGTYSGYETWGPAPAAGLSAGCDCR